MPVPPDMLEYVAKALASAAGEKAFEPIFLCIIRGGSVEECLGAGQDPRVPIPKFINMLKDYTTWLQRQSQLAKRALTKLHPPDT